MNTATAQRPRESPTDRLAQYGPAGTGRRLRSDRLRAEPRPGRQATALANSAVAPTSHRQARALRLRATTPIEFDVYRDGEAQCAGRAFVPHGGAWRNGTASEFTAGRTVRATSARISWCSISPMLTTPAAACFPWSRRSAARSAGYIATPRSSAATAPGSTLDLAFIGLCISLGCTVTHDWAKDAIAALDILKGATLSSGMYDLEAGAAGRSVRNTSSSPTRWSRKLSAMRYLDLPAHAARAQLWHLRDTGIPAADARSLPPR